MEPVNPPAAPAPLDLAARCVFELSPATMMVVASRDGRVLELNDAGRRLLGAAQRANKLHVVCSEDGADALLLQIETDHRHLPLRCMPVPGRDDVFLAALVEPGRLEIGLDSTADRVLPSIGAVTDRILHDVRNLIFPLVCHMDLAMASVDTTTEAYASLLEVQASCRRCESELEKFSALSATMNQVIRFVHVEDVLERAALLLRYVLPRRVEMDVQVASGTRLIRVSPTEFQRFLVDIVSLAHGRREQAESLLLEASGEADDVVLELRLGAPRFGSNRDYERERDGIRKVLHSRVIGDEIEVDVAVSPGGLVFSVRVKGSATASSHQLESRGIESGRGERVLVLHHQPMMRDLIRNYLSGKDYVCEGVGTLDALLDRLEQGIQAVVADISTEETRQLIAEIEAGRAPELAALVVCRGNLDQTPPIPSRRLEHPFRMDEVAGALRGLLDAKDSRR